ncbi:hypothetical protein J4U02_gp090 [Mycobacterium phage Aziz]|uniref:Uncharacterized protein n=1 Tax=Mycobacterium phage Aziz TaxID=2762281 RepID=A0A7G8LHM8_9CAUD|nr:hypothetical protein J4U02_gp090 [Mycobacterium phage Aziz]ASR75938.1 hypothetical protein SEA_GENEVAB15_92 [Mycobacterium phage GenevaB15]QNJ56750.1 hypothetical protein SEA_AZIZ_90 [Mycobacterium phage Aziz]
MSTIFAALLLIVLLSLGAVVIGVGIASLVLGLERR